MKLTKKLLRSFYRRELSDKIAAKVAVELKKPNRIEKLLQKWIGVGQ